MCRTHRRAPASLPTRHRRRRRALGALGGLIAAALAIWPARVHAQYENTWLRETMPSRLPASTSWQPLALPMRQVDVIACARRLGLTREQLIAFEARFGSYLQQACELRRASNSALAQTAPALWLMPAELPSVEDATRIIRVRDAFQRDLAQLDASLFDALEPVLSEQQQSRLLRERLRRERQRILSDGILQTWCSNQRLLIELGDLVESASLPADEREAARALAAEAEAQITAKLRNALELVTTMPRDAIAANTHPGQLWDGWHTAGTARIEAIGALVDLEYHWCERIARTISDPAQAAEFRLAHADAAGQSQMNMRLPARLREAMRARDELDDAAREALLRTCDEVMATWREVGPELTALSRRVRLGESMELNGRYMGVRSMDFQQQRATWDRISVLMRRASSAMDALMTALREKLGPEDAQAIMTAASTTGRGQVRSPEEYSAFGRGNSVTMISMHAMPGVIVPTSLPRRGEAALAQLALSDDHQAIAASVLADADEQWRASRQGFDQIARQAMGMHYSPREQFDADALSAMGSQVEGLLRELRASEAAALDALRTALGLDDAEAGAAADRAFVAQQWALIASPPRNCPAPMSMVNTSHYRTLTTHFDRVDPVAILLPLNLDPETSAAAWKILREEAPLAIDRIHALRANATRVYLLWGRQQRMQQSMMEQQRADPAVRPDWSPIMRLQQEASETATEVQRVRREHLAGLMRMHEAIAESLPESAGHAYLEAAWREACPDAWDGFDRAQRLADAALALRDLSDEPRSRLEAAWLERQLDLREHAMHISRLFADYSFADDMQRDSRVRCAPIYGEIEQKMFERDESAASLWRTLRPVLSPEQMSLLPESGLLAAAGDERGW